MDSTQGSIWRHFFCRRVPSSLTPRAIYPAPLATPSSTSLFGLFWLPRQKYDLELDFLADFHIFCRELPHISRNASRFEIERFRKKLRPSEDTSFSRFLTEHTWEDPFRTVTQKPGKTRWIWLNFSYFFQERAPIT